MGHRACYPSYSPTFILSLFLFPSLLCLFLFVLMFSLTHIVWLQSTPAVYSNFTGFFFLISSCYGARRLLNPSTIQIAWLRESIQHPVRSAQQSSANNFLQTCTAHIQLVKRFKRCITQVGLYGIPFNYVAYLTSLGRLQYFAPNYNIQEGYG